VEFEAIAVRYTKIVNKIQYLVISAFLATYKEGRVIVSPENHYLYFK